jgi:hypothetical protein
MEHGILIEPLCRRCLGKTVISDPSISTSGRRTL